MLAWAAGQIVDGKYRIDGLIGQGGMGAVYRATHVKLGQPLALKVVDVSGPRAAEVLHRFVREAQVAAAVRHRNVVYISDFGETEAGHPFMAMELLDGDTLAERLVDGPTMNVGELVGIVEASLSGLAAVHDAGIVHRDLKPQNVFLVRDSDGEYPKLLDFGLSRATSEPEGRVTREGIVVGTLEYMAPEQARAARDIDARADIYAMGALLYEGLTGEPPFTAASYADLVVAVLNESLVPVSVVRPELGEALSAVVDKALARDRAERFAGARAMRDALRAAMDQSPEIASLPIAESFGALADRSRADRRSVASMPEPAPRAWSARGGPQLSRAELGWLAAVGAVGLLTIGAWLRSQPAPPVPTSPPIDATPPPTVANAPPAEIHLELAGVPTGAEVTIDGARTAAPIVMAADGRTHEVAVRAEGSAPWRMTFPAIADARVEVRLEPVAPPPPSTTSDRRGSRRRTRTGTSVSSTAGESTTTGTTGGGHVVREADF